MESIGEHSLNLLLMHAFLLPYVYKYCQYDILTVAVLLFFCYILSLIINALLRPIEYTETRLLSK